MTFDADSPSLMLAVVGTGVMGRGIAQIAALVELRVPPDLSIGVGHQALQP